MVDEALRRAFDGEARIYGPNRSESLDQVQQRLERQATAAELVDAIAQFHGRAAAYTDATDWARQCVTVLLAQFDVRRRA